MAWEGNRSRAASAASTISFSAPPRPDFILVAEFCEIVGPRPLFTIPADLKLDPNDQLSLDGLSLWLLSADTQSCIRTESRFAMPQDTQAIMTEPVERVHALVQYSQLFDINARGYTRTFCIAYVADHCEKLIKHYDDLIHELSIVSRLLHFGNQVDVLVQVERQLHRLHITSDELLREQAQEDPDDRTLFTTLQNRRDDQIKDLEGLKAHVDQLMKSDTQAYELMDQYESLLANDLGRERRRSGTGLLRDDSRDITRSRSQSFSERVRSTSAVQQGHLPEPINFIKLRDYKAPLRPLSKLAEAFFGEIMATLQRLHSHYQRAQGVLMMEQEEAPLLGHPAFLLTIGRCVVQSFYMPPSKAPQDGYSSIIFSPFRSAPQSARLDTSAINPVEFSFDDSFNEETSPASTDVSVGYKRGVWFDNSFLRNANPEDATYERDAQSFSGWTDDDMSMHSAFSTMDDSVFTSPSEPGRLTPKFFTPPDSQLSHGAPLTSSPRILGDRRPAQRKLVEFDNMDLATPRPSHMGLDTDLTPLGVGDLLQSEDITPEGTAPNTPPVERRKEESALDESGRTATSDGNDSLATVQPTMMDQVRTRLSTLEFGRMPGSRSPKQRFASPRRRTSRAEVWNDSIASQQFQQVKQCKFPFQSAADHVTHGSDRKPGHGMLKFRNEAPFAKHVAFALLSGWTLVVTGQAAAVKAMVKTLWFFVPGNSPWNKVSTWKADGQLRFRDLSVLKLVGMAPEAVKNVSKGVLRSIAVYDIDHQVYYGPAYKGVYVRRMFTRATQFASESSLLAHLHDQLLQLGWRAFQYFHEVCLADGPLKTSAPEARSPHCDMLTIRSTLAAWGVSDGDVDIAIYLAETVQAQLVMESYRQEGINSNLESAESPGLPIKLRHQTKTTFYINEKDKQKAVFADRR
eukprot:TRINITY_DN11301_c0_g1_i1.p1 TRINITY_DN11301_c0_g1~~TRINITY_DN11301_c0_g1_i1.p1  ORF type:complete len:914 (+),score=184.01 TRINITY_DN11301_c0_g1_i1:74-2815(+)